MKIYTKTGDDGTTGLFGGGREKKASLRVEAYGTVDELNAALGMARTTRLDAESDGVLARACKWTSSRWGRSLPAYRAKKAKLNMPRLSGEHAERLEKAIDVAEARVPPLKYFVLSPAGIPSSRAHLARTVSADARSERCWPWTTPSRGGSSSST